MTTIRPAAPALAQPTAQPLPPVVDQPNLYDYAYALVNDFTPNQTRMFAIWMSGFDPRAVLAFTRSKPFPHA